MVSLRLHQIHVGYSLCISAATTVAQCGITDSLIKTLGQWQSSAYTVHIWTPRETLCAVAWSLIPPALGLRLYHFGLTYRPIHWYLVVSVTTCMCCIPWIWCSGSALRAVSCMVNYGIYERLISVDGVCWAGAVGPRFQSFWCSYSLREAAARLSAGNSCGSPKQVHARIP